MKNKLDKETKKDFQMEYTELGLAIRHYSALRFAILTVFFALVGGLVAFGFKEPKPSQFITFSIKLAGLVGSLAFWIFEVRLTSYMRHFENRIEKLETALGYQIYFKRGAESPLPKFMNTPNATQFLYWCIILFWIVSFYLG